MPPSGDSVFSKCGCGGQQHDDPYSCVATGMRGSVAQHTICASCKHV